jgi:hypothetical protein
MKNSINYFKNFPSVMYNGKSVVNITKRTKIVEQLYSQPINFLTYTVNEGERAEEIAYHYYNDIGKVWLVYLANNIIDPSNQWPLDTIEFNNMIMKKYEAKARAYNANYRKNDIVNWTMNATISSNILYYKDANETKISKDTYDLNASLQLINAAEWSPVRIYDHEYELNENKRVIFLFNRAYAAQAESELKELLSV